MPYSLVPPLIHFHLNLTFILSVPPMTDISEWLAPASDEEVTAMTSKMGKVNLIGSAATSYSVALEHAKRERADLEDTINWIAASNNEAAADESSADDNLDAWVAKKDLVQNAWIINDDVSTIKSVLAQAYLERKAELEQLDWVLGGNESPMRETSAWLSDASSMYSSTMSSSSLESNLAKDEQIQWLADAAIDDFAEDNSNDADKWPVKSSAEVTEEAAEVKWIVEDEEDDDLTEDDFTEVSSIAVIEEDGDEFEFEDEDAKWLLC